jgi:L-aminopeptidase/D-esterase-like protein
MTGIDRRRFTLALAGGITARVASAHVWPAPAAPAGEAGDGGGRASPEGSLTDVEGLRVGNFTDARRPTGCTVVLAESGAVCGVDVRGGAPGTRETDLLDPVNTVQEVHAVVLSGGSAFGLDTATGVMRYLEEKRIGFPAGPARVPIVPAAILFDLGVGDWTIRPDAHAGYEAARTASPGPVAEGNVGAGAGATVGKLFGPAGAMKGGLGTVSIRRPDGVVVAALVAVNSVGDVLDPESGRIVAGARAADGKMRSTMAALVAGEMPGRPLAGQNTSIGVVATNVRLTKTEATKVAQMAHDGLARAIRPVHTPWDGDTLFALSSGRVTAGEAVMLVGALAAEAVSRAVVRAVKAAAGLPGLPAAADLARG